MGYTHYFTHRATITPDAWAKICAATIDALKYAGVHVVYESDQPNSMPQVNADQIRFNGVGEQGHETFVLSRELKSREGESESFGFCKTAQKRYDVMVTAVLCIVGMFAPYAYKISSDGDSEDWRYGSSVAAIATRSMRRNLVPRGIRKRKRSATPTD